MHFVDAKGILSAQNGMNTYRGCSHGCIYCDARSRCYNFTHEFEDIEVKQNAPELLEKAMKSKRKRCMIGTGAMCDPYLHIEEKLGITRKCLELIDKYEFGVALQTKSPRVLRDLDLLDSINKKSKAVVQMTLTTFDDELCKKVEPNVAVTSERYKALKVFQEHGIPTIVWITPILPFINDTPENLEGILGYCEDAGVRGLITFGLGLTLRDGDREYFYDALDRLFPGLKEKYIKKYGLSYEIPSPNYKELNAILRASVSKNGFMLDEQCFEYMHTYPERYTQLSLFDIQ